MANSSKPGGSGCLSGILRHLLCRNGIPTYPSTELDHTPVKKKEGYCLESHGKEVGPVPSSLSDRPGIVARLMGLETLPVDSRWVPNLRKSPDSVPRSRSVNFMDYMLEIDLRHVSDSRHRRVRTSVSFREDVPPTPRRESDPHQDLLVLYISELENNESKKDAREKSRRPEPGLGPLRDPKQKDKRSDERKASEPRNESRRVSKEEPPSQHGTRRKRGKLILEKEVMAESKFTKKRREGKAIKRIAVVSVESDISSETSSPVSVLDRDNCVHEQGSTSTSQEDKESVRLSPKNDLSPASKFLQPAARIPDPFERRGGSQKRQTDDDDSVNSTAHQETDYCFSVAMEVYRLTEYDIVNNSSWADLNCNAEEFSRLCEEISALIEHQVLEQVVGDLSAT